MQTDAAPRLAAAVAFGEALIRTRDLDPVYEALVGAGLPRPVLERWLVAYWLFYSAGLAADVCEATGGRFWSALLAAYETAPRGAERRHFRGAAGRHALEALATRFPQPEALPRYLYAGAPLAFAVVSARSQALPQFGPWIAWKAADMGERVLGVPIGFTATALDMYRDPRQGAALIATGDWAAPVARAAVVEVVLALEAALATKAAPPRDDRPINVQEIETILCKYKAHTKGHYPVGKDSRDIAHSLAGRGAVAARLADALRARCSEVP